MMQTSATWVPSGGTDAEIPECDGSAGLQEMTVCLQGGEGDLPCDFTSRLLAGRHRVVPLCLGRTHLVMFRLILLLFMIFEGSHSDP